MRWILIAVLAAAAGCQTPAEQRFAAADSEAVATYVRMAQPAVEAYCDAQGTSGEQLRADTRALAATLTDNCAARLRRLTIEQRTIDGARAALDATAGILDAVEARKAAEHAASRPGQD